MTEALSKVSKSDDILAAMEIVSALHQRFTSQFSPMILVNIMTAMSNPGPTQVMDEKEETARISRQKSLEINYGVLFNRNLHQFENVQ